TVGIPRLFLEFLKTYETTLSLAESYDRIIVSVPTVLNVIYQHNYALQNNPRISHLIARACGGRKSGNFHKSKMVYATTETVVNHLKLLYRTKPKQLERTIVMIDEAHHPSTENYTLHGLCNW